MPRKAFRPETDYWLKSQSSIFVPKDYILLAVGLEHWAALLYPEIWDQFSDEAIASEDKGSDTAKLLRKKQAKARDFACGSASPDLLSHLHRGSISAYLHAEGHNLRDIPTSFWSTHSALNVINDRALTLDFIGTDFVPVRGVIILDEYELWSAIQAEKSTREPFVDETDVNPGVSGALSPYILFMARASNHFDLRSGRKQDGSRILKEQIVSWLNANWPSELGQPTPSLVGSMATFIRHPADGSGGNTKGASRNGR